MTNERFKEIEALRNEILCLQTVVKDITTYGRLDIKREETDREVITLRMGDADFDLIVEILSVRLDKLEKEFAEI